MTTKKRIMRNVIFLILAIIIGGAIGFFAGRIEHVSWPSFLNVELLQTIGRVCLTILYPLTFYLIYQTNKYHVSMEKEEDEDKEYELYRRSFKTLESVTILFNITSALTLFTLFVGVKYAFSSLEADSVFWINPYNGVILLALIIGQIVLLKTTQKIRKYKLSMAPTVEEMKKFAFSFDEGELQANYEQSFLILFNLNQWVIPSLYVLIWLVGLLTPMNVVSAYIVLTIIFIYINVMFYPMVKKYFK
ncbi:MULTISPECIES: DUF3169 family protein [Streptococcus]|uniref:DUF3169 family protein n=1 Tax=Streptococcus TaxID=1301 RepID=UPI0001BB5E6D|nr:MULTISPECIES: DUF3169 family protein [Streptococcus]EEY80091.1 hypothetical protein HMPREF0847_01509 [Streptococcus sp. 2_1_36FAA]